jgi:hypothetical protein
MRHDLYIAIKITAALYLSLVVIALFAAGVHASTYAGIPSATYVHGVPTYGVKSPRPTHVRTPGRVDSDRNLAIREDLLRYWDAELNGTVPYPYLATLRHYRHLEGRYFIWKHYVYEYASRYGGGSGGGYVWSAARYVTHRYRIGTSVYLVKPPPRFTIGPVEWLPDGGWEKGLYQ